MQANQPSITTPVTELFGNPFPSYVKMRREAPVFYDAEQQLWIVFRYEDVKRIFFDCCSRRG